MPKPPPTYAELAREVLLHRMRDYSENYHCAGWLGGLEFLLWESPSGTDDSPSARRLRELIPELRALAEIAGGWWVHRDVGNPAKRGPVFISLERWEQILAKQCPATASPSSAASDHGHRS